MSCHCGPSSWFFPVACKLGTGVGWLWGLSPPSWGLRSRPGVQAWFWVPVCSWKPREALSSQDLVLSVRVSRDHGLGALLPLFPSRGPVVRTLVRGQNPRPGQTFLGRPSPPIPGLQGCGLGDHCPCSGHCTDTTDGSPLSTSEAGARGLSWACGRHLLPGSPHGPCASASRSPLLRRTPVTLDEGPMTSLNLGSGLRLTQDLGEVVICSLSVRPQ